MKTQTTSAFQRVNKLNIPKKNQPTEEPHINVGSVCGSKLTADRKNSKFMDGGLRTKGIFKKKSTENPLVSIVTVCLNSAKTIETCINSVLSQTYNNIEYIIIDGWSKDDTLDI